MLAVVGCGRVGLALALCLAARGERVLGVETNPEVRACLQSGRMPFADDFSAGLFDRNWGVRFTLAEDLAAAAAVTSRFVLALGTPLGERLLPEQRPLVEVVFRVLELGAVAGPRAGESRGEPPLIIIRSTVAPGTSEGLVRAVRKRMGLEPGRDYFLAVCPERTLEGHSEELLELPQIIGAAESRSRAAAAAVFERLGVELVTTGLVETELAKLYDNAYRYVNFALGNELMMLARAHGGNAYEALRAANHGYRRGGIPAPGFAGAGKAVGRAVGRVEKSFADAPVDGEHAFRSPVPREPGRPFQPPTGELPRDFRLQRPSQSLGEGAAVVLLHEQGGLAGDLGNRGALESHHRNARGHRLQDRVAETLVEGGEGEHGGPGVESGQVGGGDLAEDLHPVLEVALLDTPGERRRYGTRPDQDQLGSGPGPGPQAGLAPAFDAAQAVESVHEKSVVFPYVEGRDVKDVAGVQTVTGDCGLDFLSGVVRTEELPVHAVVDHGYLPRVDPEAGHQIPGGEAGDGDDAVRPADQGEKVSLEALQPVPLRGREVQGDDVSDGDQKAEGQGPAVQEAVRGVEGVEVVHEVQDMDAVPAGRVEDVLARAQQTGPETLEVRRVPPGAVASGAVAAGQAVGRLEAGVRVAGPAGELAEQAAGRPADAAPGMVIHERVGVDKHFHGS